MDTKVIAARLVERYGKKQAINWAIHFAYNNYDEGAGRTQWLAIAETIRRMSKPS